MIEIRNQLQQTEALSTLILQVHDELIFEAAEDELEELEKLVKQAMESVFELSVPLKVDIGSGSSWYDAKWSRFPELRASVPEWIQIQSNFLSVPISEINNACCYQLRTNTLNSQNSSFALCKA